MTTNRDPIDVHVGGRLRQLRTSGNMSLEALGSRIGVTYQQIQKYETGANRVSASMLYRIALTLGVGPAYFFEGYGDEAAVGPSGQAISLAQRIEAIPDQTVVSSLLALIHSLAR